MNTPPPMASPPPLLREWSYTGPQHEPPVAPAVVVEEEEEEQRAPKNTPQQYTYPVATFVSNLVSHIYTGAETIDEASPREEVPLTVRSEDVNDLRRMDFSQTVSARSAATEPASLPQHHLDEFDDAEFVIVDGDLVAIPAPPPNEEEMDEIESQSRRSNRGLRRNFRGLRKFFKKRATRKQEDTTENERNKRKRKTRRRSWRRDDESEDVLPTIPPMAPITELHEASTSSAVSAHFVGNVPEAGILPADAYIETDEKEDELTPTVQAEKIDVDSMLYLARHETDLEQSTDTVMDAAAVKTMLNDVETSAKPRAQRDGCPLSTAVPTDQGVYNDTLKIVMVGDCTEKSILARALRNNHKRARRRTTLGVDVHTWTHSDVKFSIWDVQGATCGDGSANAGAHPSTQSLFFSPNSLYVLVWDLAANNLKAQRRTFDLKDDDDDDDDDDNEFLVEEANRQADGALEADIYERVLTWIDCIPESNSAILPVVIIPQGMDEFEVQRRCSLMQALLMSHLQDREPKLIFGSESILRVDLSHGVEELQVLQATIVAIATDQRERVFEHVLSPVSPVTVEVLEIVRRFRHDHKVILLDHLLAEMNVICNVDEVTESLHFLASIGELLYFGTEKDDVLSRYIILSRKWLVSALSCILRNDLKRELSETRRFMNMQCAYSGQAFPENEILKTMLSGTNSSCPILSSTDSSMLWQSMSFMREAADRTSLLSEAATPSTMFEFLERLLVHMGVFRPLNVSAQDDPTSTYFVPSLLAQGEPSDVWTYKASDSWITTLCHSWLMRNGAPSNLMEHVSVSLIRDLYEFAHSVQPAPVPLERSTSYPLGHSSMSDFLGSHESVGRIKIHHIMCWKSSVLVKVGCIFVEPDSGEIRESFAEIFVSLLEPHSVHSVASNSISSGMSRLVICGKGQAGHFGRKLWKSGYGVALDSIKASLADLSNVDRQVVCPECLAHLQPSMASVWSWDEVRNSAQTGNAGVRCTRGHLVDTNLLCGTCNATQRPVLPVIGPRITRSVPSLLPSVVLVGLWDEKSQEIRNVGSGFVVDKKLGLVVTAGHILFNMKEGHKFGQPYFGLKHARAVVGMITDDTHTAKFRYFAEIAAHDVTNIDACVLRITSRMEHDVEGEGEDCANQSEIPLMNNMDVMKAEKLPQLKMTRSFELEEAVRILGFNQGGEGLLEEGKHINRSADFAKGYICKKFKAQWDDSSCDSSSSSMSFSPREEIVVMCPTISGHSGGPCVNDEGRVLGILSRADPVERQRCYLVPASELRVLVSEAKGTRRVGRLEPPN